LASAPEASASRATALNGAGCLAWRQGDYEAARALHEECLAIHRASGNRSGIAASLNNLGLVTGDQGDYETTRLLYEESLAIRRELGERSRIADSLEAMGELACGREEPDPGVGSGEASVLPPAERPGDVGSAIVLGSGDPSAAPGRAARLFAAAEALREALS